MKQLVQGVVLGGVVALTGCATAIHTTGADGREIYVHSYEKPTFDPKVMDNFNYPVLYHLAAVNQAELSAGSTQAKHSVSVGEINASIGATGLATHALGFGSIVGKGLSGTLLVTGLLAPASKETLQTQTIQEGFNRMRKGEVLFAVRPLLENSPLSEVGLALFKQETNSFTRMATVTCGGKAPGYYSAAAFGSSFYQVTSGPKACFFFVAQEIVAPEVLAQLHGQGKRYSYVGVNHSDKLDEVTRVGLMQSLREFAGKDGSIIYRSADGRSITVERQGQPIQLPLPANPFRG